MTVRVGLIGLGTVGAEAARTLAAHAEMITARAGAPVVVTEVSARSRSKDRGYRYFRHDVAGRPIPARRE